MEEDLGLKISILAIVFNVFIFVIMILSGYLSLYMMEFVIPFYAPINIIIAFLGIYIYIKKSKYKNMTAFWIGNAFLASLVILTSIIVYARISDNNTWDSFGAGILIFFLIINLVVKLVIDIIGTSRINSKKR